MFLVLLLAATWAVETHSLPKTLVTNGSPKLHTRNPGFSSWGAYFKFIRRKGGTYLSGSTTHNLELYSGNYTEATSTYY